MLVAEQKRHKKTEAALAAEFGWQQETFNTWKRGAVPRPQMYLRLAQFLKVSAETIKQLADEARNSTGNAKLPKLAAFDRAPLVGKIIDRKLGKFKFLRPLPTGRYAVAIDTEIMEPALLAGRRAWFDPLIWPQVGNEVIVHAQSGLAWIGRLSAFGAVVIIERESGPKAVDNVEAAHVLVLSERV